MRIPLLFIFALAVSAGAEDSPSLATALKSFPSSETAIRLFNGKDLTGWDGAPGYWSVEEGVIKAVK
jgi:hypothetical protein